MSEQFTCDACGETCDKGRSDEEAKAESKLLWGKAPSMDFAVICDDCFKRGFAAAHAEYRAGLKSN